VKNLTSAFRVAWYAVLSGANDYRAIFTIRSWVFGWMVRVLSQVTFFALIGRLLRSDVQTQFLLVGNAVMVAGLGATFALNQTSAERANGTLPLLLASPSRAVLVFASRGVYVMADGVLSALLGLFILGPAFGLHFPWPRVLLVIPLTLLVGLSAYFLSTFLAGVILSHRHVHNIVVNVTIVSLMALCGANVPMSSYPRWLELAARCLPITNGLEGIRAVIDGSPRATVVTDVGVEAVVAAGYLLVALLTFGKFLRRGRLDGSLEFAS
jgi:ABC-2 type transport system permease protein